MSWVVVIIFSARFEVVFVVFMIVFSLSTKVGRGLGKSFWQLTLGLRQAKRKAVTLTAVKAAKALLSSTHVSASEASRISISPYLNQFPRGETGGLYPRQLSRQATPALNMEKALTRGRL